MILGSVEPLLTLLARPRVAVVVRTASASWLLLTSPRMHKPMMSGTEHSQSILRGKHRAAFSDRFDMMDVQRPLAVACKTRESALCVSREDAAAEFPPRLCVVQLGHKQSLPDMLPSRTDG